VGAVGLGSSSKGCLGLGSKAKGRVYRTFIFRQKCYVGSSYNSED